MRLRFWRRFPLMLVIPIVTLAVSTAHAQTGKDDPSIKAILRIRLGHLCRQKGCVEHVELALRSNKDFDYVRTDAASSTVTLAIPSGKAVDLWRLRTDLRRHSIGCTKMTTSGLADYRVHIVLPHWQADRAGPVTCPVCRNEVIKLLRSTKMFGDITFDGPVVTTTLPKGLEDICALLDWIERAEVSPQAVWLAQTMVGIPQPAALEPSVGKKPPSTATGDEPRVCFVFNHQCKVGRRLGEVLGCQDWAVDGQVEFDPVSDRHLISGSIAQRRRAAISETLAQFRDAGRITQRIRLTGFGDLRLELEFAHICGEVEYSQPLQKSSPGKPPAAKVEKEAVDKKSAAKDENAAKKPADKPFVPRPLRPDASSNGRKAIEKAIAGVSWIHRGTFNEYHTKPVFTGPTKWTCAFKAGSTNSYSLDELLTALEMAGFPPTKVQVSSLFPGMPFGELLPIDIELKDALGSTRRTESIRQPGRPFVLLFIAIQCPKWDKYKYEADPALYGTLRQTIEQHKSQFEFVVISSNPDDSFGDVVMFLRKAGIDVPLLHDSSGRLRAILNAQITPPPHVYVFDGARRLRYAGEPHNHWNDKSKSRDNHLGMALERVLAGNYLANDAVFFNSPKCNCATPSCSCPKCGCGPSCRCAIGH